jgi:hypothetical protein
MRRRQTTFEFRTWGGRRNGAGRPRTLPGKPELPHSTRKPIPKYVPALVTLRIDRAVPSLRNRIALGVLLEAFGAAKDRLAMRITHFGVESNHLHFIVEGVNAAAMKGLGVRIARRINRLAKRKGRVIGDRYHAQALRSPAQVRNAIHYVLWNHKKHTGHGGADAFTSMVQCNAVVKPRTWLLVHSAPS